MVEVDETFITSRHGRRGRWVRRHPFWIFGGTERGSGISFMIPVPDRKAATLLQLIGQHVRPATTLSSDMWRSYGGIRAMPQRFQHWVINHTYHFVDPANPQIHTQNVENLWSRWKSRVRRLHGIHDRPYQDHIYEFNWRQRFKRRDEKLHMFWTHVAENFPCHHE